MNNTIDRWNAAAERYAEDQEQNAYADSNKAVVTARFSGLSGERVLDLGCGYGWFTDYFRSIGGDPVDVDGSEKMIGIARERYPECSFSVADITKPLPFEDRSFDMVFCNQVFMDIEDPVAVFAEIARVLRPGGIFWYSIVHSAFYDGAWLTDDNGYKYAKEMAAYIKPYRFTNNFWGETDHFHRPLSYYLNTAADNGFVLKHTEEPVSYDGIAKNSDLPLFFFAEYVKA